MWGQGVGGRGGGGRREEEGGRRGGRDATSCVMDCQRVEYKHTTSSLRESCVRTLFVLPRNNLSQ